MKLSWFLPYVVCIGVPFALVAAGDDSANVSILIYRCAAKLCFELIQMQLHRVFHTGVFQVVHVHRTNC